MGLPIKIPSETEAVLEDVASPRALSTIEGVQTIRGMPATGAPNKHFARGGLGEATIGRAEAHCTKEHSQVH